MRIVRPNLRCVVSGLLVCVAVIACDAKEPSGGPLPSEDAGLEPRVPLSVFDAGVPASGEFCTSLVAAECDGNEDCSGGQVCCGNYNGQKYTSVVCQDTCDDGFVVCHPGEACAVPPQSDAGAADAPICRRSGILPSYLAVCLAPNPQMLTEFTGLPAAAQQTNCGEGHACNDGQQCCVLASWDAMTRAITPRSGYCAPLGAACPCNESSNTDGGL